VGKGLCRKCKYYSKGYCQFGIPVKKRITTVYNYADVTVTYDATVVECSKFEERAERK